MGIQIISHVDNSWKVSCKVNIYFTSDLVILLLCANIYSSSILIVKTESHLDECSSVVEEINCYIHETEYNSVIRKNKLSVYATSSMLIKCRMLSTRSQIQKDTYYVMTFIQHSIKGKTIGTKKRLVILWNLRWRRG